MRPVHLDASLLKAYPKIDCVFNFFKQTVSTLEACYVNLGGLNLGDLLPIHQDNVATLG